MRAGVVAFVQRHGLRACRAPACAGRGDEFQRRALGDRAFEHDIQAELQRVGLDGRQFSDLEHDPAHMAEPLGAGGVFDDLAYILGE